MESQAVNRLMANQYWQILIRSSLLDIYSIECPPQGRYIAILISRRYYLFQLAIAECCRHFLFVCVSRSTKKRVLCPCAGEEHATLIAVRRHTLLFAIYVAECTHRAHAAATWMLLQCNIAINTIWLMTCSPHSQEPVTGHIMVYCVAARWKYC